MCAMMTVTLRVLARRVTLERRQVAAGVSGMEEDGDIVLRGRFKDRADDAQAGWIVKIGACDQHDAPQAAFFHKVPHCFPDEFLTKERI